MNIKLAMFEGPLDLLLHLIEAAELDIYDIPIAYITEQYLIVLNEDKELKLDITSEFLIMAATLLSIKSRMLLPPDMNKGVDMGESEWEDPRRELVDRLLEYKQYKVISEILQEKEEDRSQIYSRLPMDLTQVPVCIEENVLSPHVLLRALSLVVRSSKNTNTVHNIGKESISISECIEDILFKLKKGATLFSDLFTSELLHSRERVITTFIALLELIKQKRIICQQKNAFDDIFICATSETK